MGNRKKMTDNQHVQILRDGSMLHDKIFFVILRKKEPQIMRLFFKPKSKKNKRKFGHSIVVLNMLLVFFKETKKQNCIKRILSMVTDIF